MIEKKPYLSKNELSFLLGKKDKNLDKKITMLIRDGFLIPLKKGLYTTRIYSLINKDNNFLEYLANIIYYPSYISLEYVLARCGAIPEAVYVYTSVSSKTTRLFENQLGVFSYRNIKSSLFTGYDQILFNEKSMIKIARKSKALFDFFYFKPFRSYKNNLEDLRINWDSFDENDLFEFKEFVELSQSPKMERTYQLIREAYDQQ